LSNYLTVAKLAVQFVAGMGISKIFTDIVNNNVTIVTTTQLVAVKVGAVVMGSMLVEQSSLHIERQTNNLVAWNENRKAENETKK
jgi:hypothetical protein